MENQQLDDCPVEALGFAMVDYQVPSTCPMNNHDLPSLSILKQMPEGTSTESVRWMGNIPLIIIMGIIHGTVFFSDDLVIPLTIITHY